MSLALTLTFPSAGDRCLAFPSAADRWFATLGDISK